MHESCYHHVSMNLQTSHCGWVWLQKSTSFPMHFLVIKSNGLEWKFILFVSCFFQPPAPDPSPSSSPSIPPAPSSIPPSSTEKRRQSVTRHKVAKPLAPWRHSSHHPKELEKSALYNSTIIDERSV